MLKLIRLLVNFTIYLQFKEHCTPCLYNCHNPREDILILRCVLQTVEIKKYQLHTRCIASRTVMLDWFSYIHYIVFSSRE